MEGSWFIDDQRYDSRRTHRSFTDVKDSPPVSIVELLENTEAKDAK